MNEQKILSLFSEQKTEKAFQKLYQLLPQFKGYVIKQRGSSDQAEDIFQDALIVVFKKLQSDNFQFTGSLKTYLFNTAKYMWWEVNGVKKEDSVEQLDISVNEIEQLEEAIAREKALVKVEEALKVITGKCKEILEAFYYQKLSMTLIAMQFGYATINSAKNQKYKCLERARNAFMNL